MKKLLKTKPVKKRSNWEIGIELALAKKKELLEELAEKESHIAYCKAEIEKEKKVK